jgi:hypothetical protein
MFAQQQKGECSMGLYDALSAKDLAEGMANAPDHKKGVPNHAKTLNQMLIAGTTWKQIDIFLSTCTTKQFAQGGWDKIKDHLNFCRKGKNNNGKTNTWVFNVGNNTDDFCDRRDPKAIIRLIGFSNGVSLLKESKGHVKSEPVGSEDFLSIVEDKAIDDVDFLPIEGAEKYMWHRTRERDPEIIRLKKASVLKHDPLLRCEVCSISMEERYGLRGAGFCEVHHRRPLFLVDENDATSTQLGDLAILCPNCHRMIHRYKRETLTIQALKDMIKEGTVG